MKLTFAEASIFLNSAKQVLTEFAVLSLDSQEMNKLGGDVAFGVEVAINFAVESVITNIFFYYFLI